MKAGVGAELSAYLSYLFAKVQEIEDPAVSQNAQQGQLHRRNGYRFLRRRNRRISHSPALQHPFVGHINSGALNLYYTEFYTVPSFTADTYVHSAPAAHIQMASTFAENIPMLQGVESGLVDPILFDSVESAPVFSSIQNTSY